jgi:hypothetical protein
MARGRLIRASEIGEHVYCRRAWWLRHVEGLEPEGRARRERGTALHARHGRRVRISNVLLIGGALLLVLAVTLFALA